MFWVFAPYCHDNCNRLRPVTQFKSCSIKPGEFVKNEKIDITMWVLKNIHMVMVALHEADSLGNYS